MSAGGAGGQGAGRARRVQGQRVGLLACGTTTAPHGEGGILARAPSGNQIWITRVK